MAAQNQTFYCCKYSTDPFQEITGISCEPLGIWTVEVLSASSPNTFGSYNNSFILSRTCATMSTPPCFGGTVAGEVIMGCVPQSLYPITLSLRLKRNNVFVSDFQKVITSGLDCSNCESMCGVLS